MDQVFAVRHECEKYLANRKDVFLGVCGFGKYLLVRLIRTACGKCLRVYVVGKKFLKAELSFCVDSCQYRPCVRIRMNVSELFPVNVKLRLD